MPPVKVSIIMACRELYWRANSFALLLNSVSFFPSVLFPRILITMKSLRFFRLPLASLFIFSLVGIAADEPDPGQIEISVGQLLMQGHYSRKRLDDGISR